MNWKILLMAAAVLPLAAGDQMSKQPAVAKAEKAKPPVPTAPVFLSTPQLELALVTDDLTRNIQPADRPFMRYITTWPFQPSERERVTQAVKFWVNSLHWRSQVVQLVPIADGRILRLDLRDPEWDATSRTQRLAVFESRGAAYAFANDAAKAQFLDVWEKLVANEPYFRATAASFREEVQKVKVPAEKPYVKDGHTFDYYLKEQVVKVADKYARGWVDPVMQEAVQKLAGTYTPVVRADWFLTQTGFDRDPQRAFGIYSDFLMLPVQEADLYKILGVDLKRIDEDYLAHGGAVQAGTSIVAKHNRELQLLPSIYGQEEPFLWRTFDTASNIGDESVTERLIGTVKIAGREIIASLPNGMHMYYLANAAGAQVGEVPINIAADRFDPHDERVINAYKCVSCHGPVQGIQPFKDVIRELMLNKDVALLNYAKQQSLTLGRRAEDYYLYNLPGAIGRQQNAYMRALTSVLDQQQLTADEAKALTGSNSRSFLQIIDGYLNKPMDLEAVGREMGLAPTEAKAYLLKTDNQSLLPVAAGHIIARDAFEKAYPDAMRTIPWPWDEEQHP